MSPLEVKFSNEESVLMGNGHLKLNNGITFLVVGDEINIFAPRSIPFTLSEDSSSIVNCNNMNNIRLREGEVVFGEGDKEVVARVVDLNEVNSLLELV